LDDMAALKVGLHNLNAIVVDNAKFTWGFTAAAKDYSNCSSILRAELLDGAEFYVPASEETTPVAIDTYFNEIYVEGDVTMSGWSSTKSLANANLACSIEMAKAASLTFERITFKALNSVEFIAPYLTAAEATGAANQKANCAKVIVEEDAAINFATNPTFKEASGTVTGTITFAKKTDYSDVSQNTSIHFSNVTLN